MVEVAIIMRLKMLPSLVIGNMPFTLNNHFRAQVLPIGLGGKMMMKYIGMRSIMEDNQCFIILVSFRMAKS